MSVGVKRRPREEWVIQRDALITDTEAEEIHLLLMLRQKKYLLR
jgi:catechol-2,3-dioxygenase